MRNSVTNGHWSWATVPLTLVVLILLVLASRSSRTIANELPCSTTGSPSVGTDKSDYEPNQTVIISGEGFDCNTLLTVKITRPDGTVVKGDGSGTPGSDSVTTDNQGAFTYNYKLNGIDGLYTVELVGPSGNVLATAEFEVLSHFRYGTLSWSPTGNPREVEIRLKAAFRRSAYGFFGRCIGACPGGLPVIGDIIVENQGPTGFAFGDGTIASGPTGTTLRFLVTGFDTSDPTNFNEHWVIGEALDPATGNIGIRHTYSAPGPFLAYTAVSGTTISSCCRIGQFGLVTLNNRSGLPYPIQTLVEPQSGNNSLFPA